jgi:hypothetical protein
MDKIMSHIFKKLKFLSRLFFVFWLTVTGLFTAQATKALAESGITSTDANPHLVRAVICEQVKERKPRHESIVFSITKGRVYCYTDFDPVSKKTHIYHNWFRRDTLTAKVKLALKSPRWSTFSYISLRKTDKGPWRLEITSAGGDILHTLRFSITD